MSCGSRTRLAGLEDRSLCRSAKDTSCFKRKVRESNPQGREARPGSSGVPSPVGLTFRKAAEAGIEPASGRVTTACPYQHEHHRINSVRTVGFEPTISCSQGTRDARLPHILNLKSAQWESNPHIRHGKAVGCRYIMGACWLPNCQRSSEHRVGIEPTSPRYEGGILPLDDQCLSVADFRPLIAI